MKIFIGGSVSENIEEKYKIEGEKLVDLIVENNFDVVCCADLKEKKNSKIILTLPKIYLKYAKDIKDEIQIVTNTINERTDESIKNSDVCLFMPGGIGTTYEILSSMETKRAGEHNNKIVIVNLFGYYNEFFKMLDEMYEKNFINESDKNMYKIVDTIEEAIDYIKK